MNLFMKKQLIIVPIIFLFFLGFCSKNQEKIQSNEVVEHTQKTEVQEQKKRVVIEKEFTLDEVTSWKNEEDYTWRKYEGMNRYWVDNSWVYRWQSIYIQKDATFTTEYGEWYKFNGKSVKDHGKIILTSKNTSIKSSRKTNLQDVENFWRVLALDGSLEDMLIPYIDQSNQYSIAPFETIESCDGVIQFLRKVWRGKYIFLSECPYSRGDFWNHITISYVEYKEAWYTVVYNNDFSFKENWVIFASKNWSYINDYYNSLGREFRIGKFSNQKMNQWYQDSLYQISHLDETIKMLDLKPR